jgi:hypothetical protein
LRGKLQAPKGKFQKKLQIPEKEEILKRAFEIFSLELVL